jgi:sodium/potassium-transporting ATPase subunit alpha
VAAARGVRESDVALADPAVGALVLPGYALPGLSKADWDAVIAKDEVVFARTTPQQKLEIVRAYQAGGHVVAVTGDGTNDAPALKAADIGISMGGSGASDVAREAADMILLDDDFSSIVGAIEMGRTVFDNIRKTVAYTLAHLIPELVPLILTLVADVPLMISGLFILVIDCITEQGPAISLSTEPAESSVMSRPPRNLKTDHMVDARLLIYSYLVVGVAEAAVCVGAFLAVFAWNGVPASYLIYAAAYWKPDGSSPPLDVGTRVLDGPEQATLYFRGVGAYFLSLVLCQGWHIWLVKARRTSLAAHGVFRNTATLKGVAISVVIALLLVYLPVVQGAFWAAAVPAVGWGPQFLFAVVAILYTEAVKARARADEARVGAGGGKEVTAAGSGQEQQQQQQKLSWVTRWLAW